MYNSDEAVLDRFFASLASGDLDLALACLTPDARIWHCFDGVALEREASLAGWNDLVIGFPERAFVDVRRHPIPGGFVQQHMMTGRTANGAIFAWPICVVVRISDGLIARIDEYIDRAGRFELMDLSAAVTPGL